MSIDYIEGDATAPAGSGPKIIAHVCNDVGGWGAGFVLAISRRWPEPEARYRQWYGARSDNDFGLGAVQVVQVEPELHVANMVAQRGVRASADGPPIRYDALAVALQTLGDHCVALGASAHMPRIGCGLAGGDWSVVGELVETHVAARVATWVYDFRPRDSVTSS